MDYFDVPAGTTPKIMVVSDIHWAFKTRYGIYEGNAFDDLLGAIRTQRPAHLIMLGDLDHGWSQAAWTQLTDLVRTTAIFGNHDNVELLLDQTNTDGTCVMPRNGETRNILGIKFGFMNGIAAKRERTKDGAPRITPERARAALNYLVLSGADALCMHESMYYELRNPASVGDELMRQLLLEWGSTAPPLILSGHVSRKPYHVAKCGTNTLGLRVQTSPQHMSYLTIEPQGAGGRLGIALWMRKEKLGEMSVSMQELRNGSVDAGSLAFVKEDGVRLPPWPGWVLRSEASVPQTAASHTKQRQVA